MNVQQIALRESCHVWAARLLGSPPDIVVEEVADKTLDVVMRLPVGVNYARVVAHRRALRLAQKEWTKRRRMEALQAQMLNKECESANVESLVESRIRLQQVVARARHLSEEDRQMVVRLIYDETTCADKNAVRRLRRVLEG